MAHHSRGRSLLWSATGLVMLLLAASCSAGDGRGAPSGPGVGAPGAVDEIVTGLELPWSMVVTDTSVLVSERDTGRILEITGDGSTRDVTAVAGVRVGGEGGLLGLAVDPQGEHLYAYSTANDGNRVERYDLRGAAGSFELASPVEILGGLPSASTHNGGRVAFGPDGMLYVTVGDAGDRDAAQDRRSLAGKILRVRPDGSVPADNPFPGSPVYSLGHRNPQGIAWAADGRLFASEFGQNDWDELNIIEPGGNYGWPIVEGIGDDDRFTDPVQVWKPADASPSGLASDGDTLYLANLRGERLRAIPVAAPDTSVEYFAREYGRLRDAAIGPDGRLWIATSNAGGRGNARPGDDRIVAVDLDVVAAR